MDEVVTVVDQFNGLKDETLAQKELKRYGVNVERMTGSKPIPTEWKPDIIREIIISNPIKTKEYKQNTNERAFVLSFSSEDEREKFENYTYMNMFSCINKVITEKGAKPEDYSRVFIIESKGDGNTLVISY